MENKSFKKFLFKIISKILICVVILIIGLIIIKARPNLKDVLKENLYEKNIDLAYFNSLYNKYLGDIIPIKDFFKTQGEAVFSEKLEYQDESIYKDGVALTTADNYLIPAINSGVVTFVGEKEGYGNVIIIEGEDKVSIWYGGLNNIDIDIYDYIEKGEFLSETKENTLYLVFEKDGTTQNYKDYLS